MPPGRRGLVWIAPALLGVACLGLLAPWRTFGRTTDAPETALDGRSIDAWVGTDRVIWEQSLMDLGNGVCHAPPDPPALPEFGRYAASWRKPSISPDGKWWLYLEQPESTAVGPPRLRLIRHDGKVSRRIDIRARVGTDWPYRPGVWLPDSSGWVLTPPTDRPDAGYFLYRMARPERPTRLADPPSDPIRWVDHGFARENNPELVTDDGYLAFRLAQAPGFYLHPLDPRKPGRTVPIRPPVGTLVGLDHPQDFEPDFVPATLAQNGRFVLALVLVKDGMFTERLHRLLGRPVTHTEVWRLPVDGGAPRRLLELDASVRKFSLAPDSRTLVYWSGPDRRAFRTRID